MGGDPADALRLRALDQGDRPADGPRPQHGQAGAALHAAAALRVFTSEAESLNDADPAEENVILTARRNDESRYGFAAFDVAPGHRPGGTTELRVTYYRLTTPTPTDPHRAPTPFDRFSLRQRRPDG